MPVIVTGKHIYLEVSKEQVYIRNGKLYELALKTPMVVNHKNVVANFNTASR